MYEKKGKYFRHCPYPYTGKELWELPINKFFVVDKVGSFCTSKYLCVI